MNMEEMGSTADEQHQEEICKKIFERAMNGKWNEVVTIYGQDRNFNHKAPITRAGDTALHVAVMDGQEKAVEMLVEALLKSSRGLEGAKETLRVENERGNTPLHLAAAQGSTRMCQCIARVDSTLIGKRNKESETPFFLAAERGQKEAFLCLHRLCGSQDKGYSYCRKNNGETILHSAIYGEYFDLAFIILHEYGNLVNYVNEQGFSPLHLLASKPSAFRSGSRLGRFSQIIYYCTSVDKLKKEVETTGGGDDNSIQQNSDKKQNYPPNYHTCASVLGLFPKVFAKAFVEPCDKWTEEAADAESQADEAHGIFPPNYGICFEVSKFMSKAMLIVLGFGSRAIKKVREKKEKHTWSVQIMDELLQRSSAYEYEYNGQQPQNLPLRKVDETTPYDLAKVNHAAVASPDKLLNPQNPSETSLNDQNKQDEIKVLVSGMKWRGTGSVTVEEIVKSEKIKRETPILIAAKNGVTEMVEKILEKFPVAIHDVSADEKNIVLLAVENRQPHVYKLLKERNILKNSVFRNVDKDGNSALHLAATLGEHRPWLIPGAALQMQWEIKWYEYVKDSMPLHFFRRYNKKGQTSRDVFTETHMELVKAGGEWLTNTSESCSVVAALIATVAFATASTVPGGVDDKKGTPTLENQPPFDVFAISSLVALCFSVTALVMFLAILTSRYQEKDFHRSLPRRVLVGLTSLFVSIGSMLISFCAGHFFVLKDNLKFAALPVYAVTCLPITFFAIAQFPLYFDFIWATIKKVPQRSYKVITS